MRANTVLRTFLALHRTRVLDLKFEDDALVVHVAPTWSIPRCSGCGKKRKSVYDSRVRSWRHLDLAGVKTILRSDLRRVSCKKCGVLVETVPWAESASRYTFPMEGLVAYHAQKTDKTTVATLMRIAWRTVGQIVTRFVHREREEMGDPLDNLRHIGVDEISYRKHHQYITTVVDHDRGIVVWAAKGKSAETLKSFFEAIGPERSAKVEAVTIDMSSAFIKAVKESVPNATLIFDRFHVQRLVHDALDEVRRDEVRSASADEKTDLKKTRWPLQKRPWNLSDLENAKLADLEEKNLPIYRAYLLKESLATILDGRQIGVASRKLDEWIDWARSSGLPAFVRTAGTIEKHREGILAYVAHPPQQRPRRRPQRQNPSHHAPRLRLSFRIQPHLHALPMLRRHRDSPLPYRSALDPLNGQENPKKYGYHHKAVDAVEARVIDLLTMFATRLEASSGDYLFGKTMTAADVQLACSVALFAPLPVEQCAMLPPFRTAYESLNDATRAALNPILLKHRDHMYEKYLELPLSL